MESPNLKATRSFLLVGAFLNLLVVVIAGSTLRAGGIADAATLEQDLTALAHGSGEELVGIAVRDDAMPRAAGVNLDERFPLQSVMKLIVAAAALDAVDRQGGRLDEPVLVRREDLSLNVQPLAKLVGPNGYRTTLDDLLFRAVVDSDSAAADLLFARAGGTEGIREFLARHQIIGVRVDRDERHLQTETGGLNWLPEYVDPAVLEAARAAVPESRQEAAWTEYRKDPRDTATPAGMADFLHSLAMGKLLSARSTKRLLTIMQQTVTFPDRLKAGAPADWQLGHKTGSSGTRHGMTAAINDVGIFTAPDGGQVAVVFFIKDSRRSSKECAALMAQAARVITAAYHRDPAPAVH